MLCEWNLTIYLLTNLVNIEKKMCILQLQNYVDFIIRDICKYIFQNVFLNSTDLMIPSLPQSFLRKMPLT